MLHAESGLSGQVGLWDISAMRTKEYFAERAAKGDIKKALQVLKRAGKGKTPVGDELPQKGTRHRR
jgi:hypothetical protein